MTCTDIYLIVILAAYSAATKGLIEFEVCLLVIYEKIPNYKDSCVMYALKRVSIQCNIAT